MPCQLAILSITNIPFSMKRNSLFAPNNSYLHVMGQLFTGNNFILRQNEKAPHFYILDLSNSRINNTNACKILNGKSHQLIVQITKHKNNMPLKDYFVGAHTT